MSLKEWWDEQHRTQNLRAILATPYTAVWNNLGIVDRLIPYNSVLDIGVGSGVCVKNLLSLKMLVSALDISTEVSKATEGVFKCFYSPKELPSNCFDLAVSHLVAQYITDDELAEQVKNVTRSLKIGGIFSLQYAVGSYSQNNSKTTDGMLKAGKRCRHPALISDIIHSNGGEIIHMAGSYSTPEYRSDRVHIVKKGDRY